MILQIVTGILRAILAAWGGKMVEQGLVSSDDLSQAIGAVLVVVTIGWSAWQKYRTHTVPGGAFNPKAPVRRARFASREGGYVAWDLFAIAIFVACFWTGVVWVAIRFFPAP